jgi:hypothetical protein
MYDCYQLPGTGIIPKSVPCESFSLVVQAAQRNQNFSDPDGIKNLITVDDLANSHKMELTKSLLYH